MVGEEYYEDFEEDELEEQVEKQKEVQDEIYGETPSYEKKEDLYTLFWKVVKALDSSKVGNLDKTELGMLSFSVRDCQKIAQLAETLGHKGFAKWILGQGEIVLATSASKLGWLPELFVSQRKFTTKARESRIANLPPPKKKGLFKK